MYSRINWRAHGKAMNAMIKQCVHFTKKIPHKCLPTLERLNKFDSGSRRACPGCLVGIET